MSQELLLVEDDDALRKLLGGVLRQAGYAVVEAGCFAEAQRHLESGDFGLVLADINLGDGSGVALGRQAKEACPDARVLIFTGDPAPASAIEGLEAGVDYYLQKPFAPTELLAILKHIQTALPEETAVEVGWARPDWYEFRLASAEDSLLRLQSFMGALFEPRVPPRRRAELRQAIDELARNAIEWGNAFDVTREVVLSIAITDMEVIVKVEDQGEGFCPERIFELEDGLAPDDLQDLRRSCGIRNGGNGLRRVRELADRLIFSERGNAVLATFAVQTPGN